MSTLSRETAALTGEDWEKVHQQAVKERKKQAMDLPKSSFQPTKNPDQEE